MSAMGSLDIRWPIGFIFTIYGVILLVYGAVSSRAVVIVNEASMNVDAMWGGAFLAFGLFMGTLAIRSSRQGRR